LISKEKEKQLLKTNKEQMDEMEAKNLQTIQRLVKAKHSLHVKYEQLKQDKKNVEIAFSKKVFLMDWENAYCIDC
jgi:allophanate hydrolase subunit 1